MFRGPEAAFWARRGLLALAGPGERAPPSGRTDPDRLQHGAHRAARRQRPSRPCSQKILGEDINAKGGCFGGG